MYVIIFLKKRAPSLVSEKSVAYLKNKRKKRKKKVYSTRKVMQVESEEKNLIKS